jgi:putative SOS response-associated peptidase YedK
MCNLYSMTKGQDAIRQLFGVKHDRVGNLPPLPGIFPDMMAPIIRKSQDGEREPVMARWGMPTPPQFRKGPVDRGVTEIRKVDSAHWRGWLKPEAPRLVRATSFGEPTDLPDVAYRPTAVVGVALRGSCLPRKRPTTRMPTASVA